MAKLTAQHPRLEPAVIPPAELQRAVALHQSGALDLAKQSYDALLRLDANQAQIHLLMGVLLAQQGKLWPSLAALYRCMLLEPHAAQVHFNLGLIHHRLDHCLQADRDFARSKTLNPLESSIYFNQALNALKAGQEAWAIECLQNTLILSPADHAAWNQLASIFNAKASAALALACAEKALQCAPHDGALWANRAQSLHFLGDFQASDESFKQATDLDPMDARWWFNHALMLSEFKQIERAKRTLHQALCIDPAMSSAWFNLGVMAREQGQLPEGLIYFERCLCVHPMHANAHNNLGVIYKDLQQRVAAMCAYEHAIVVDPSQAQAHSNQANLLQDLGDVLGALTCYQRALSIDPLDVNVNLSLAFACLQVGRFEQGWNAYEWRWKDQHLSSPILQTQKPMLAKQQRTKRLLIWPEQGVGTEVMFSRFFHRLHELAYEVIIKMDPRLIDLMQRSFTQLSFQPNDVHIDDSQFDHHLPLASLAQHWIQSMADLRILSPRALSVDSIKKKHLLQKHPRQRPIWVGINWRSRSKTTGHDRSFDLMEVLSQLKRSDVTFVNLQYGSIKEELQTLEHTDIDFLDVPDVDKTQDLDGLAALCACCDVVISADNSTAHLCGAMGVPTWMGLPMNADWRWFKDMAHTPWYPNMRLFRQTRLGSWREVFLSMKEALDQAIERHHFNA